MAEVINIQVEGGTSKTLLTAGKYCDKNIKVTASGINSSDATASERDMLLSKTAYSYNGKITGTIETYDGLNTGGILERPDITYDTIATSAVTGDINLSVASVSSYAFANCDSIKSVYAPNVTTISNYGFYHTGGITDIYFPKLITIGESCLSYMPIKTLDLPECTTIGASSFNQCTKITSINLPKVKAIPNSCLAGTLIKSVVLPEAASIGNSSLSNSINLTYVDLPKCKSFSSYVLRNSSKFATLILRADSVCTLGSYALNSTAISKGTGYVYVPSALIASYQAATNWVKIYNTNNNVFRALEDYTVDGTITGELDETKI